MESVLTYIKDNVLLFDGAMGTRLREKGWDMKCSSETLNISMPDLVEEIHKEYIEAGAKVITTNTFMCNIYNEEKYGYVLEDIIKNGVNIANKAVGNNDVYIALSCGPTGEFFSDGNKNIKKVYENYKRIAIKGEECGVDLILLETLMNIDEVKIALRAVKENSKLPLFCTMSTWGGEDYFRDFNVKHMCRVMEENNCDVLGINCSASPNHLYRLVDELVIYSKLPIMIKPNNGGSKGQDKLLVKEDSIAFCNDIINLIDKGVSVVGGCCGTNPEYIKLISEKIK